MPTSIPALNAVPILTPKQSAIIKNITGIITDAPRLIMLLIISIMIP
ncbi:hypothetical protein UUU_06870 [Klebsiella pneumoniae subsp. pneumoniae DSM 30104 = JCM 1662 = NBRC 14940]|nr:hypothetical protein UUU_06870 [Klebsiella pneumoniae subsp. pneumoniae DSM 30104 = JCM 1662 = NBRC 14940]